MSTAYGNALASNGTTTLTQAAGPSVSWNLTSLIISQAGPASGVNAKVTVYDGAVGGTVLYVCYLNGPGALGTGIGSVGTVQEVPLPRNSQGIQGLQGTPGNAMNIQVTGTGVNQVAINARFTDGLS